jgi:glycosyltransferase involved in cell wall biosynthesis
MKVSIITVSYNSARTIRETIESVLSQDYPNLEYLVVDGGSTDGTLSILREYADRITRWVSEKDDGMYDAMNKGIAMATGDVIGILNSDDTYMTKHVVSKMMQALTAAQADVVFADLILVNQYHPEKVLRYYDSSNFKPSKFRYGWMPAHPTVFIRKSIYDAVGPFATDYKIAADYEMLIRILAVHAASYCYVAKPIVRMRSGGASTAGWSRNWILNQEIVRACRANGIQTNMGLLLLKIPAKLWGAILGRFGRDPKALLH